ncbi:hypothetical protein [Caldimonas brevitalea]|uniref:Uncharacterized protein n=1 Tax=Caldimonas brevitalea TaxID=413882 RepID=A0A0G3BLG3_9BURK|nr:hypothetical protein [Caldimonas brevitalea]AKJ28803.1 hypothetical protein AAW51_2112 [Caldimonas brevitalea]
MTAEVLSDDDIWEIAKAYGFVTGERSAYLRPELWHIRFVRELQYRHADSLARAAKNVASRDVRALLLGVAANMKRAR